MQILQNETFVKHPRRSLTPFHTRRKLLEFCRTPRTLYCNLVQPLVSPESTERDRMPVFTKVFTGIHASERDRKKELVRTGPGIEHQSEEGGGSMR